MTVHDSFQKEAYMRIDDITAVQVTSTAQDLPATPYSKSAMTATAV